MLDRIRRAQDALRLARGVLQIPLRRQRSTVHALVSDHPGERAPLCRDRILQKQQALNEGFRPRRAPGDVHNHRQEFVYSLDHRVDVVHAP
jgi:hypothetical protein